MNYYIIDVSSILYDSSWIDEYKKEYIVIPISVIDELRSKISGNEVSSENAREFLSFLNKILTGKGINEPVDFAEGGSIVVHIGLSKDNVLSQFINPGTSTYKVLETASYFKSKFPDDNVKILSYDSGLQVLAKSIGIETEVYMDKTKLKHDNNSIIEIDNINYDFINALYERGSIDYNENLLGEKINVNQNIIIRGQRGSVLAYLDKGGKLIR
jgi:predicted ribonuclease YlaK